MSRSLLIAALLSAGLAAAEDLGPAQFKAQLEEQQGLVLDVRTPGEVARGKLPSASVIDFTAPKFEQKVSLIARDKPVFVYCASGNRSRVAVEVMKGLGFTKVYNLSGGIRGWTSNGYSVESVVPPAGGSVQGLAPEAFDALKSVKVIKVDLDQSEALGAREKVQGVPVFVLYVDGKERGRLMGEQTREALEALAKK